MLRDKLNGLPTTLESTYDQILTRIQDVDAMNAMKLILWLTFSKRPIHVEDLALILEFDVKTQQFDMNAKLDYPDDVLKICSSLVTKMEDETVQFAHASIKEYFQSGKREISSAVKVDPHFGHYFIGQCSLTFILQRKQVIPEDVAPASKRFENTLLRYAAHFWPKHILTCKKESAVMNQVIKLFESQSLTYWVNAYNYKYWNHDNVQMIYPNYLQIAALHGLIETVKWLMQQPVNSVECMEALSAAASNGHINIVTLLVQKGNIQVTSTLYCQALHRASRRGESQVVRLLCEHGKDSDVFQKFINVAIWNALMDKQKEAIKLLIDCSGLNWKIESAAVRCTAREGDVELVQLMIEKELDENRRKKLIVEAVEVAASAGHNAIVDLLLRSDMGISEQSAPLRGLMHDKESFLMHKRELFATALNNAACHGHKAIVELLLENGADMKAKVDAVALASRQGYVDIVELLLNRGIEMKMYTKQIDHALHAAAHAGHERLVKSLLERGADPNPQGEDGQNPLHAASLKGYKDIAQLLIDNGADVNAQGGEYGYAIWAAMSEGYNEIVKLLLQYGASPSIHSGYDGEALEAACKGGYRHIVELLLNEGVDVNAIGKKYDNGLISALRRGNKDIVKLLLEKGAYINGIQHNHIPLHVATEYASEDIVRMLLEWGANVNIVGGFCGTALQAASYNGKTDSVQLLLEWGADVNIVGGHWGTALQAASGNGKDDSVQLLLEWGANVNVQAGKYGSALTAASFWGHKSIVELLLEWGADVNLHGGAYGFALIAAIHHHHTAIAKILLSQGSDVTLCDEKYGSALIQAASCGNKDIVEMLLQSGSDVNIQGEKHGSALYAAAKEGHTEIAQLLLAHGAKYLGAIVEDTSFLVDSDSEESE